MTTRSFTLDSNASRLIVHTRAEGLLARLAHDLELSSRVVSGSATLDGDTWTAGLRVPVSSLVVEGVLHGDTLDRSVLSAHDREQILDKMKSDVFGSADRVEVEVEASGSRRDRGESKVRVGRSSMNVPLLFSAEESAGALRVSGSFDVSIKALGGKAIKGPLGAFSVKDGVKVRFELLLREQV